MKSIDLGIRQVSSEDTTSAKCSEAFTTTGDVFAAHPASSPPPAKVPAQRITGCLNLNGGWSRRNQLQDVQSERGLLHGAGNYQGVRSNATHPLDPLAEQAQAGQRTDGKRNMPRGHIRFARIDADERASAEPGDAFTGAAHRWESPGRLRIRRPPAVHPKASRATRPCCDAGRRPARNPSPSR